MAVNPALIAAELYDDSDSDLDDLPDLIDSSTDDERTFVWPPKTTGRFAIHLAQKGSRPGTHLRAGVIHALRRQQPDLGVKKMVGILAQRHADITAKVVRDVLKAPLPVPLSIELTIGEHRAEWPITWPVLLEGKFETELSNPKGVGNDLGFFTWLKPALRILFACTYRIDLSHWDLEFLAQGWSRRADATRLARVLRRLQRLRHIAPLVGRWRLFLCGIYEEVTFRPGNQGAQQAKAEFESLCGPRAG